MSVVVAGPGRVYARLYARTVVVRTVPVDPINLLSARERETLRMVCTIGTDQTARSLRISLLTVKNHLTSVYRKVGLAGPTQGKIGQACFALAKWEDRAR